MFYFCFIKDPQTFSLRPYPALISETIRATDRQGHQATDRAVIKLQDRASHQVIDGQFIKATEQRARPFLGSPETKGKIHFWFRDKGDHPSWVRREQRQTSILWGYREPSLRAPSLVSLGEPKFLSKGAKEKGPFVKVPKWRFFI